MLRYALTDEQWERIEPLLPGKATDPGATAKDNSRWTSGFVDAAVWIARTGAPWRDLPERFGRSNSVYQRFDRRCKRGVWDEMLSALGGDPDLEELLLDSTVIRAHQHAAGAKGGSRLKRWAVRVAVLAPRSTPRLTAGLSRFASV